MYISWVFIALFAYLYFRESNAHAKAVTALREANSHIEGLKLDQAAQWEQEKIKDKERSRAINSLIVIRYLLATKFADEVSLEARHLLDVAFEYTHEGEGYGYESDADFPDEFKRHK